jgi:hypothetical protein
MKAISLWQPYAAAIALGLKKYETRSWSTKHRGKIAIHSSVKPLSKEYRELAEKYELTAQLQFGKVLVICDLEDCILMDDKTIAKQSQTEIDLGDWRAGRYDWKLRVIEVLAEPIPARGYQGLWNWIRY